MQSARRMKKANEKFRRVIISHDMTKLERVECQQLVQQAKEMESQDLSGEFHLPGERTSRKDEGGEVETTERFVPKNKTDVKMDILWPKSKNLFQVVGDRRKFQLNTFDKTFVFWL